MTKPDSPARTPAPDPAALGWLERWHVEQTPPGGAVRASDEADMYTRDVVLQAFAAGRASTERVDVATAGVDLLREAAALLSDRTAKAIRSQHMVERIEEFLARPGPSLESYKQAWEQLSRPLRWMQENGRLLPARCLGLSLAEVANVLISDAVPRLALVIRAQRDRDEDEGCPVSDPGCLSRADERHDACERDPLPGLALSLVQDLDELIGQSDGVYGLHQNGDPAPWGELTRGGRFEDWLSSFDRLRDHLDGGAGRCRVCGCTEDNACVVRSDGRASGERACGWADSSTTLCDSPACIEADRAARETRINAELAALPDPPMVGDVAEVVQRHAPGWAFQFDQNVANTGGKAVVRLTIYDPESPL